MIYENNSEALFNFINGTDCQVAADDLIRVLTKDKHLPQETKDMIWGDVMKLRSKSKDYLDKAKATRQHKGL